MKRRIATIFVTGVAEEARVDAFLLAALCESSSAFGTSASFELPEGDQGVVWLDVSGVGHLHGGEAQLARALLEHTRQLSRSLGFEAGDFEYRVVIASGPRVGRLLTAGLSSWGPKPAELEPHLAFAVAEEDTVRMLAKLPVELLLAIHGNASAASAFWRRLGIVTIEQLLALPLSTATARLGPRAREILALARGEDRTPLTPHHPPRTIELGHAWEEACAGLEPLRFVLRGLFDRVGGRLSARGEGATRLTLRFDWQVEFGKTAAFVQEFSLSAPLLDSREFERIVFARLGRLTLPGPIFGVTVMALGLTAKQSFQLELSADPRGARRQIAAELELPLLVTELENELGAEVVGCLSELSSHCPEERSELVPFRRARGTKERERERERAPLDGVTRLLPRPVLLALPPTEGGLLELGERVYRVRELRFLQRLDEIRWWTRGGTSRDYFWMWLAPLVGRETRPEELRTECALVYADKRSARGGGSMRYYLQGFGSPGQPLGD